MGEEGKHGCVSTEEANGGQEGSCVLLYKNNKVVVGEASLHLVLGDGQIRQEDRKQLIQLYMRRELVSTSLFALAERERDRTSMAPAWNRMILATAEMAFSVA